MGLGAAGKDVQAGLWEHERGDHAEASPPGLHVQRASMYEMPMNRSTDLSGLSEYTIAQAYLSP